MTKTFFFYDLETSGLSARDDRIMQFAGQRTDLDFNPIGDPVNELIRLSDDTLPSPEALCVTGITPQSTIADGYSEAEFAHIMVNDIFTPDTIAVGFNNIRLTMNLFVIFCGVIFMIPMNGHGRTGVAVGIFSMLCG